MDKIGLGGGCHWCTEAVFQMLKGVSKVDQGFIASKLEPLQYSEAVIVHFDVNQISFLKLIEIHLSTHNSNSTRSQRLGYCSAIYFFKTDQEILAKQTLEILRKKTKENIITQVLQFHDFKPSPEKYHNYFLKDPNRPFCKTYITPKISKLEDLYPENLVIKGRNG